MTQTKLSEAEAELYDRQIRLWGIESQEKLRAANVLLIHVRGLGSEIAKNILLSGINSLTILDDGVVTAEELTKNFLLEPKSVGDNIAEAVLLKAQLLNPLVKIVVVKEALSSQNKDFFKQFTIIVGTGMSSEQILLLSKTCRENEIKFICGDVCGMFGYSVADFQNHQYYEDRVQLCPKKKGTKETKVVVKVEGKIKYADLEKVLKLPKEKTKTKRTSPFYFLLLVLLEFRNQKKRDPSSETKNEDMQLLKEIKTKIFDLYQFDNAKLTDDVFSLIFGEVVPVCSIVGGVIAQEVIKAVSHKEVPINNVFLLNPFTFSGHEETIAN